MTQKQALSGGSGSSLSTPQFQGWQTAYHAWGAAQQATQARQGELNAAVQAKTDAESALNAANEALSQAQAERQQKEQARQAAEENVRAVQAEASRNALWSSAGVQPVYVMFMSPRDLPGTVSGEGQDVGEGWLNAAASGDGAPIPKQIADKLHGKDFSSFREFRNAFWTEVGKDPELLKQFKPGNVGNIQAGKSLVPRDSEQVGGRVKYELHHVKPIKDNGSVYDIDNIRVTTPKRHIEIHKGSK
ncbi:hypothetical protein [Type-D symbiont of Plautia stali]|uniref:hypothetical protein n=1 Tax=Type-D symbiont of Plautia stali TaxID=1560356 RepID=UPI000B049A3D|nr:hypothetical protein [Type-D symbiont of Plautia stali]